MWNIRRVCVINVQATRNPLVRNRTNHSLFVSHSTTFFSNSILHTRYTIENLCNTQFIIWKHTSSRIVTKYLFVISRIDFVISHVRFDILLTSENYFLNIYYLIFFFYIIHLKSQLGYKYELDKIVLYIYVHYYEFMDHDSWNIFYSKTNIINSLINNISILLWDLVANKPNTIKIILR